MCQLAAYIGDRPIAPLLMNALRYQEGYFGGQATGLATLDKGHLNWVKEPGAVDQVIKNSGIMGLTGTTGIAHSRLSLTSVTDERYNRAKNAHPFLNTLGTVALMHNGIIMNYEHHWAELAKSIKFSGYNPDINYITDSEVAVHMVDRKLKMGKCLKDAIRETAASLTGMVLLLVISVDEPETVYVTNWIQSCTLGKGDNETMFSSSPLGFTDVRDDFDVFTAPRNSLIKLTRDRIEISKLDPCRFAPDTSVNYEAYKEAVVEVLGGGGTWSCLDLLLELNKSGGEKAFDVSVEEWKEFQRLGWGDQNQIMEPLIQMAEEGVIRQGVEQRPEGGIITPRVIWSLP